MFKINFYKVNENFCKSFYETYMKITREYWINCEKFQVNLEDNENLDRTSYQLIRSDFSIVSSNMSNRVGSLFWISSLQIGFLFGENDVG